MIGIFQLEVGGGSLAEVHAKNGSDICNLLKSLAEVQSGSLAEVGKSIVQVYENIGGGLAEVGGSFPPIPPRRLPPPLRRGVAA